MAKLTNLSFNKHLDYPNRMEINEAGSSWRGSTWLGCLHRGSRAAGFINFSSAVAFESLAEPKHPAGHGRCYVYFWWATFHVRPN